MFSNGASHGLISHLKVRGKGFFFRDWERKRRTLLAEQFKELPSGARILDAGCGSGRLSKEISDMGFKVVGVDISDVSIAEAKEACTDIDIEFVVASLERKLPFNDGEFRGIWCSEVLEHVYDVKSVLRELHRVLSDEGILVITVPYHGMLKNLAIALFGFDKHFDPYSGHIRFFSRDTLKRCLQDACFIIMESKGIGRFVPLYMSLFVTAKKQGNSKSFRANA